METETVLILLQIVTLIGIVCLFFFRKYLFSYASEKGKNLATKEDITQITNKIEAVKHDYASQLESTKAGLSSQISTHSYRYEKEYDVLSQLAELLFDVRDSSLCLRPMFNLKDPSKTEDEIKAERLERSYDARRKLFFKREQKKPFFPTEIYEEILKIDKVAQTETIDYEYEDPYDHRKTQEYWDRAQENRQKIADQADKAIEEIRKRIKNWDTLSNNL